MKLVVSRNDLGTSEQFWAEHGPLAKAPPLVLPEQPGRVVIIAPHPDDEVLAVGGLMRLLLDRGHSLDVVAVTDGEGSHPQSRTITKETLASRRHKEREKALSILGLAPAKVRRLRFADGAVGYISDLDEQLGPVLDGAALCLAPWDHDGHPDHDATGRAAMKACAARGVTLLQYPVWAWHWANAEKDPLPWARARRVALDEELAARKSEAIDAYQSQVEPLSEFEGDEAVLLPEVLARFKRSFEIVFT